MTIKILGVQAGFVNLRTGFFFSAPTGSIQIEESEWESLVAKNQIANVVVGDEDEYGSVLLDCLEEGRIKKDVHGHNAYTEDDVYYKRIKLSWSKLTGDFWVFEPDESGELVLKESNTVFQDAYIKRYGF